jgi:hypothetical protein
MTRERTAHPTRIGARKIAARNQRVGGQRAALIGPQRLALPLSRLAVGSVQTARGTAISVVPKVPIRVRVRLPCRWPAAPVATSVPSVSFARLP